MEISLAKNGLQTSSGEKIDDFISEDFSGGLEEFYSPLFYPSTYY